MQKSIKEDQRDKKEKHHTGKQTKTAYVNQTISMITLNVSGLKIQLKDRDCQTGKQTSSTACCLQEAHLHSYI